jgi:hypothetical protein
VLLINDATLNPISVAMATPFYLLMVTYAVVQLFLHVTDQFL